MSTKASIYIKERLHHIVIQVCPSFACQSNFKGEAA